VSTTFDATYDPADDKLRLRASSRLDAETYAKVKAAGFGWAPKQDLLFAAWTPAREDLLVELAGDIGDEETSLEERAAQRAERFETCRGKRAVDAEQARKAVSAIADGIPLGQPILVGHHSERHARIEIDPKLCSILKASGFEVSCRDFLAASMPVCPDSEDGHDCALMNPPFPKGQDVAHILHALKLLKPGGRLVAICANGPRQQAELRPLATTWEELPDGTFADQGTNVRAVLMTVRR
jgi:Domain of unknown function (DUF3560)